VPSTRHPALVALVRLLAQAAAGEALVAADAPIVAVTSASDAAPHAHIAQEE
jgi:hypothetical protein